MKFNFGFIAVAVMAIALMVSPVLAVTQTIVATQSGNDNVQIAGNYNYGSNASQTIVAKQIARGPNGSNYQELTNYASGTIKMSPIQTIVSKQKGKFNYVKAINQFVAS